MVTKVDSPPVMRAPSKLTMDNETREYFIQLENIIFDLWRRTGGYNDTISNNEMATNGEDSRRFVELRNLTRRVAALEQEIEGITSKLAVKKKIMLEDETLSIAPIIDELRAEINTLQNQVN